MFLVAYVRLSLWTFKADGSYKWERDSWDPASEKKAEAAASLS